MSFLTENDSTFPLPYSLIFFFNSIFPNGLKAVYISTGAFPSSSNPKGYPTLVKECTSFLSVFMSPKFCVREIQLGVLKQLSFSKLCAWVGY